MKIERLRVQGLENPLGLTEQTPVFSYRLVRSGGETGEAALQSACRILAASSPEKLARGEGDLWDSGVLHTGAVSGFVYGGRALEARSRCWWKVQVWDGGGRDCGWSEPAYWEMGLFPEDWEASWIGQGDSWEGDPSAAPLFACDFELSLGEMDHARLYVSGLGLFRASLNGAPLADTLFDPGECDATRSVYYVTYDVTSLLREGPNTIGIVLGNGQYTNFQFNPVMRSLPDGALLPPHRYQKDDGGFVKPGIAGRKKLIAQLEITGKDGSRRLAALSDVSWSWFEGPVVFQNWYGGEDYDATLEQPGWDAPGADRTGWLPAQKMEPPAGALTGRFFPPIRIVERIAPVSVRRTAHGTWLVDMGRNGAGFPELRLSGTKPEQRGAWIHMKPAELLADDGESVDQSSCTQSWSERYSCEILDSYRVKGCGEEIWHPSFCYQGFQYLEVRGWEEELTPDAFRFCIVRTCCEKEGGFACGDQALDRISDMVDHSMESNMFGAFTDCPQIEKLGWIETSHLMFASLASTYDISGWMRKILHDISDSQVDEAQALLPGNEPAGYVPAIIPEFQRIVGLHRDPNWSGACVFTPWAYYGYYGDVSVLRSAYPVMRRYLQYLAGFLQNGVLEDYAQMGEWGQIDESTPAVLVATCSLYRMQRIASRVASMLGKQEEADDFSREADATRDAFHRHPLCYDAQTGVYGNGSQASYGCALFSGLVPEERKDAAVQKLVEAVEQREDHLSSGEVGLKQVFIALAENGRNDVVWRMVMNPTAPSYRVFADRGMTTLPEYWNCDELWYGMVRSRNHAMMGHVKEWLSAWVLGVRPLQPGFAETLIAPWMPQGLTRMRGSVATPYGSVTVSCERKNGRLEVQAEVPAGMRAVIRPAE